MYNMEYFPCELGKYIPYCTLYRAITYKNIRINAREQKGMHMGN